MGKRDTVIPKPVDVRLPIEELQVLAELSDSNYLPILKRVARRYAENMRNQAFHLNEADPQFPLKHRSYKDQAVGMELLIKIIEGSRDELKKISE